MNLQSLPNTLTLGRIIAVPLFVALFYWGGPWGDPLAALVFILAAVTDWIDGYLARKLGVARTTVVARLTWTGEVARDAGPFHEGQRLTAHIAQFAEVEGGRIRSIETFDCYEAF